MIIFLLILGAIVVLSTSCGVAYWVGKEHGEHLMFESMIANDAYAAKFCAAKRHEFHECMAEVRRADVLKKPPTDLDHIS